MLRFVVFVLTIKGLLSLQENYYWREYTGTIPEDAIVGGEDINGNNIYIGQAFILDQGLIICEIFAGNREVAVPTYGVKKASTYIKILCGNQNDFGWMSVTASQLHLQMINKRPVIGGHEKGGVLFVGRINEEGQTKVGKIVSYITGKAVFYYVNKDVEKVIDSCEVLLFHGSNIVARINSE